MPSNVVVDDVQTTMAVDGVQMPSTAFDGVQLPSTAVDRG